MTIIPDSKDWTWVLDASCPECGFCASAVPRAEIPARLRANVEAWRTGFAGSADLRVRQRPSARYLLHDPIHHLYDVTGQQST